MKRGAWNAFKGTGYTLLGFVLRKPAADIVWAIFQLPGTIEDSGKWVRALLGWPDLAEYEPVLHVLALLAVFVVVAYETRGLWKGHRERLKEWWRRRAEQSRYQVDSHRFGAIDKLVWAEAYALERWRRHIEKDGEDRWDDEKRELFLGLSMLCDSLDAVGVWRPSILEGEFDPDVWHSYLLNVRNLTYYDRLEEARELGSRLGVVPNEE